MTKVTGSLALLDERRVGSGLTVGRRGCGLVVGVSARLGRVVTASTASGSDAGTRDTSVGGSTSGGNSAAGSSSVSGVSSSVAVASVFAKGSDTSTSGGGVA